jgi:hypothetical protein
MAAAVIPLAVAALPLAIEAIRGGIELYNTIMASRETPDEVKRQYAEMTASLGMTRIVVNAAADRIIAGGPPA